MSRIGRLPVPVPAGVDVTIDGNDVTVKRLQRDERRRTLALLPENPAYQPITVDPAVEEFQIEGIGVGLIRQRPSRL